MKGDVKFVEHVITGLHANRQALEVRLEESSAALVEANRGLVEREEAVYLCKIAERLPSVKTTSASLESAKLENAFLQDRIGDLDRAQQRRRTKAVLMCHAIEELRGDLESEMVKADDSMSVSNVSNISVA